MTYMTEDIAQWLGEQLDEDTARATKAAEELGADWDYDDGFVLARREGDMVATGSQDFLEAERGRFIAEHDPSRVLREIDAKRQLLDEHQDVNDGSCGTCVDGQWGYPTHGGASPQRYPCKTLRLLALPYADRPGYRDEWRS